MNIEERYLPIQCYGSSRNGYQPSALSIKGIVQHYFSAVYVDQENAYDPDVCWKLMRDLNFSEEERLYGLYANAPRMPASAHYFICRDGKIIQLVPLEFQSWHAGSSEFKKMKGCNGFMVGIENICIHGKSYTDEQYTANAELSLWLMARYGFTIDWITGHENVAVPTGRKKDPGPSFDWKKLFDLIRR